MFQAEREFVATARCQITRLKAALQADEPETARAAADLIAKSAGRVKARGVSLAARQCAQGAGGPLSKIAQSVYMIERLTEQYASGLAEIDTPQSRAHYAALASPALASSAPIDPDAPLLLDEVYQDAPLASAPVWDDALVKAQAPDQSIEQARAADTLLGLLPHARPDERKALTALLALTREGPAFEGDVPALPAQDNAADAPPLMAFEALMSPVTSRVLASAHQHGQRVALSYACDGAVLPVAMARPLQDVICAILERRMAQDFVRPDARAATGRSRTAQIALTARAPLRALTDAMVLEILDDGPDVAQALVSGLSAAEDFVALGGRIVFPDQTGAALQLRVPAAPASDAASLPPRQDPNLDVSGQLMGALA